MKIKLAALAALFAISVSVHAGVEDGLAAYRLGDYPTALKELSSAAEQGDAQAQLFLGEMYIQGQAVPQDNKRAINWFRKAAAQGLAAAQFNLGLMYEAGQGLPQDDVQAVGWYRKAAEQGAADALNQLAIMYYEGRGVTMFIKSRGVPQSRIIAYALFDLASMTGYPKAGGNREAVGTLLGPKQVDLAKALTAHMKKTGSIQVIDADLK